MNDMDNWIASVRVGDFAAAWRISAAVLAARDPATRDDPRLPYHLRWVWDGRRFDGRDVLVRCYHGLGDTLQFARYLPLLAARVATLTVEVQPALLPLLATMGLDARFHPFDPARPLPPAECDIDITELPFALRVAAPTGEAYLQSPATPLAPGTIGLCYGCGDWNPSRSVPAPLFAGLCRAHEVVTLVAAATDLPVRNPEGCPLDMAATARLVAGCAAIVTTDTMIAHLAGALGRPTALLLKSQPDWRWTPGAPTTPWYRSMRLYHQRIAGRWAEVVAAVEAELSGRDNALFARVEP